MKVYTPDSPPLGAAYRKNTRQLGFTLIELLTVMAIIGILAAILIPVVSAVRKNANIAASKTQLSGYVNAIGLFKGEYNYYPFPDAHDRGGASIPEIGEEDFIGALSATKPDGTRITASDSEKYGNRKLISFYDFSESDILKAPDDTVLIVDRFSNSNIFIAIDGDGDGLIEGVPDPNGPSEIDIRTKVTAYVLDDPETAATPDYYLYE